MSFSEFLNERRSAAAALVATLKQTYAYASVLGVDVKAKSIRADRNTTTISAGRDTECGFVVKLYDGKVFFEYSLDDLSGDTEALAAKIPAEIGRYRTMAKPAVILIPGISGNTGEGVLAVRKSVEQAVGSDIIFNK